MGLEILRQNGVVTVINAMPGGPSKRMGIRSGDLIVGIDDEDITGWDTDQAADRLRGTPGTDGFERTGLGLFFSVHPDFPPIPVFVEVGLGEVGGLFSVSSFSSHRFSFLYTVF